jgi:demethylmenaquinone methyltransferase/2-methoxy-6-polyprenyl-1,4-benzoquinol methylase
MGIPVEDAQRQMQDPEYVKGAFADIADRYVVTNHVLSLGIDILWRKRVARKVAAFLRDAGGGRVLDVATGSGDLALEIQKKSPGIEVVGTDFCEPMLEQARQRGLAKTVVADALDLPFEDGEFDALTVAFGLRNMADWGAGLREMGRVLRPGGMLVVLDFSLPQKGLRRKFYRTYLHKVLPRVAGAMTGKRDAYEYLAGTIESFPSGDAMCELIGQCGFSAPAVRTLSGGIASVYDARNGEVRDS